MAELHVNDGRKAEAVEAIREPLKFAALSENRYAIDKCIRLLLRLGIDPEEFLKGLAEK